MSAAPARKWLSYPLQAVCYAAFVAFVGYFSTSPAYEHLAPGEALVKLSLLLAEEDVDFKALAALIETDMALAAAVLKAVNSSLYGLSGRVQSVQQAITYLGTREVAAVTFEMGLRAAFAPHQHLAIEHRAVGQCIAEHRVLGVLIGNQFFTTRPYIQFTIAYDQLSAYTVPLVFRDPFRRITEGTYFNFHGVSQTEWVGA